MPATTKVAPDFLYYALVDGTSELDSVAFAKNLTPKKGFGGWRNLLDFLDTDPFDSTRLIDGAHPYLPIVKLNEKARPDAGGVAVVCPGGPGGLGKEEKWKTYKPGPTVWHRSVGHIQVTFQTFGRHTAAEESAQMISDFILSPAVQVDSSGVASVASGRPVKPGATVFRASLLYISSHGWLGGFMKGEGLEAWPDAQPEKAREPYVPFHSYFLVGRADVHKRFFAGPRWIVLAQCSTLNSATWAMWARVMANSDPPVHGILGYEESSPAAGASVGIANRFFAELRAKKPFLDAWRAANQGQHWAAIVHKDAHKDTLTAFPRHRLPTSGIEQYIGYLPSIPRGEPISDPPAPFTAQLFRIKREPLPEEPIEVTPDSLDGVHAVLGGDSLYLIRVSDSQPFRQVSVRFIHIRRTYSTQFGHAQLFAEITSPTHGAALNLKDRNDIVVELSTPSASVDLRLRSQPKSKLERSGLHESHSYLWLAISVQPVSGSAKRHDFKTLGLCYG
ncbi:MAG TPA: hypothetical protein VIL32_17710 [Steroidobacteraceae bacterium]